ncbi:hypothetical protein M427DRAFT_198964 [Gonapodya prolifera JEL478]|uniref:Uncharacterized protein n=1 Tax=Gonapodya prolifera (strain JEL478) TaxID=1344416 RepID=A0A139APV9_GONPJ|nr:hypothetical protein M427DRAFT_198964 [Gonapodya prolifera JEL478]|eukprot:KXS18762.1 hypothetical protein M427DRAFT_198964 [Gonapodya prolifera JEL478]
MKLHAWMLVCAILVFPYLAAADAKDKLPSPASWKRSTRVLERKMKKGLCTVSRYESAQIVPGMPVRYYPRCDEDGENESGEFDEGDGQGTEGPQGTPASNDNGNGNGKTNIKSEKENRARGFTHHEPRQTQTPAQVAVNVTLTTCTSPDLTLCAKVATAFQNAGKRIALVVSIVAPIQVKAAFTSFCTAYNQCGTNILGTAAPSSMVEVLAGTSKYFIPQSLFKNVGIGSTPYTYTPYDIDALFNADASWWFQGDPLITPGQEDFEQVATHELLHGMGFSSGWRQWFAGQSFLTPCYYSYSDGTFAFWGSQYIFDAFLYESATRLPLSSYYDRIKATFPGNQTVSVSAFPAAFQSTGGDAFVAASRVFNMTSSGTKALSFSAGGTAADPILWSSTGYSSGSAISHLDDGYEYTSDLLMISYARMGATLDQKIASAGAYVYGAIGPNTISGTSEVCACSTLL